MKMKTIMFSMRCRVATFCSGSCMITLKYIMLEQEVIKNGINYDLKKSITANIEWVHIKHQHFVTQRLLKFIHI